MSNNLDRKINPFPQNKGIKINTNKANWSIINNELIHIHTSCQIEMVKEV